MCDLLSDPWVERMRAGTLTGLDYAPIEARIVAYLATQEAPIPYGVIFPTALPIDSLEDENWMECDLHPRIEP